MNDAILVTLFICFLFSNEGYPNLVGHNSSKDLNRDLSLFREVIDGECYALAGSLLCRLLQPNCDERSREKVNPIFFEIIAFIFHLVNNNNNAQ